MLSGAAWTAAEIEATRARILQAIHPDWAVQKQMFGSDLAQHYGRTAVTENRIMRLVFHDCVKYTGQQWGVWSGANLDISIHLIQYSQSTLVNCSGDDGDRW